MSLSGTQYHSKIYRDFKSIDSTAYRSIIRFYERHEEKIRGLDFDEYFDLVIAYTHALFEVGAYPQHLLMANLIIETSIVQNIRVWNKEDIYFKMLFRKAASHYNLMEYEVAEHILRELVKIHPYDLLSIRFLKKCIRQQRTNFVKNTRAVSVFLILMSALLISIEVLMVRPFYRMHAHMVELSRNGIFISGIIVLVLGDFVHRTRIEKDVDAFVEEIRRRKRGYKKEEFIVP